MRKLILVLAAIVLAALATYSSTQPASAAVDVSTFPQGVRAPRGDGEFIYYLRPGNLIKGEKVRVTLDGVDMTKRKDGVWYLVSPQPNRRHIFNMMMTTSDEAWSGWTKFKKIWR